MTDPRQYPAQVFWNDEDEGFIAIAPDLPGCSAFGESQSEAIAELQNAIVVWIEAAKAAGNPVPEPSRSKPEPRVSGKLLLRLPRSLHAVLIQGAKSENTSLNQYILYLLAAGSNTHTGQQQVATLFTRQNPWPAALSIETAMQKDLAKSRLKGHFLEHPGGTRGLDRAMASTVSKLSSAGLFTAEPSWIMRETLDLMAQRDTTGVH
jgi:predicted RNase H-like HicB family nuclease